jgi:hypothetical protein
MTWNEGNGILISRPAGRFAGVELNLLLTKIRERWKTEVDGDHKQQTAGWVYGWSVAGINLSLLPVICFG